MARTPATLTRRTVEALTRAHRAVLIDDTMLATRQAVYWYNGVRHVWYREREALITSCESTLTGYWYWNDTTGVFDPSR